MQSMDPSTHTVSMAGSTTVTIAPATTTEAILTVSAPLSPSSQVIPLEAEQAVDEAAAESPDSTDLDFHIHAATMGLPHGTPPPSSS